MGIGVEGPPAGNPRSLEDAPVGSYACRRERGVLLGSEPCPLFLLHTVVIPEVVSKPEREQSQHNGCSYCFHSEKLLHGG